MNRRAFLRTLTGGLLAAPLAAEAQQPGKVWRVGYLGNGLPTQSAHMRDAFRQGLRELGWVEGLNVSIEYRWADGHLERLPALAVELLKTPVDLSLVAGGAGVRAARQASRTMEDFYYAGGVPAVLRELLPMLDGAARNVNGLSLAENVTDAPCHDTDIIRPLSLPLQPEGGTVILFGNLCPGGAVLKQSAASPHLMSSQVTNGTVNDG